MFPWNHCPYARKRLRQRYVPEPAVLKRRTQDVTVVGRRESFSSLEIAEHSNILEIFREYPVSYRSPYHGLVSGGICNELSRRAPCIPVLIRILHSAHAAFSESKSGDG